jgi:hypothetical protein
MIFFERLKNSQILKKFPKEKVGEFFVQNIDILRQLHSKYNITIDFKIALIGGIVSALFLAIHLANLLFGTNSLSVYLDLRDKQGYLDEAIQKYHLENAKLQREYFELKNLEPER